MVRDALIHGLDDEEIRLDILGESRQDLSLEDTLSYVEAKESGKRSASHLIGDSSISAAAVVSSYKCQGKVRAPSDPTEGKGSSTCCNCGRTGHGSSLQERSKKCPAFGNGTRQAWSLRSDNSTNTLCEWMVLVVSPFATEIPQEIHICHLAYAHHDGSRPHDWTASHPEGPRHS